MIDICGTEFDLDHSTSIYVNCDCMDGMKQFPDKYFDLAMVDPPYGIDIANMNMGLGKSARCPKEKNRKWKKKNWDKNKPDNSYFDELFRVSKNQIIWGGNYFELPSTKCFLIWDKAEGMYGRSFSECEFAWTSFNGVARIFKYAPFNKQRIHPTQKPVALYEWILTRYAKDGDVILDTHVGSASSLIACRNTNHKFVGFELDEHYYKLSKERLDRELAQMNLYDFIGG